jgi:phosphoenolpyruvate carboxylase
MKDNTPEKSIDEKTKEFYSTESIPEEMKQALAFMRQWLNEDRKATPMVTARDLWHWLERDYNKVIEAERQKREDVLKSISCAECDGTGAKAILSEYAGLNGMTPCPTCDGTGYATDAPPPADYYPTQ